MSAILCRSTEQPQHVTRRFTVKSSLAGRDVLFNSNMPEIGELHPDDPTLYVVAKRGRVLATREVAVEIVYAAEPPNCITWEAE